MSIAAAKSCMRRRPSFWLTFVIACCTSGAPLACSERSTDCHATRSCELPIGGRTYLAGSAGAAGITSMSGAGGSELGAVGLAGSVATGTSAAGNAGDDGDQAGSSSVAGTAGLAGGSSPSTILLEATEIIRVRLKTTAQLDFALARNGVASEVSVRAVGLPFGVSATVSTLPANVSSGSILLTVTEASHIGGPHAFTLSATPKDDSSALAVTPVTLFITQASGQLDVSFGAAGVVTTRITDRERDTVSDVALDAKGRTILVGCGRATANDLGWVARLTAAGAADVSFSGGILTNVSLLPSCAYRVLEKQLASYIWAVASDSGSTTSFIRKLTESGETDYAFGAGRNGNVPLSSADVPRNLITLASGLLTLAEPGNRPVAFTESGTQSPTFASPADLVAHELAVDASGRVLYAQVLSNGFVFGRLTATGQPDATFGSGGVAPTYAFPDGATSGRVASIMSTPTGGFFALVETSNGTTAATSAVSVLAYSVNGTLDVAYSAAGRMPVTATGAAYDAVLDPSGHVIVLYGELNSTTGHWMKRLSSTLSGYTEGAFATNGQLDLTAVAPDLIPQGLEFDAYGNRVVVFGAVGANVGLLRIWL